MSNYQLTGKRLEATHFIYIFSNESLSYAYSLSHLYWGACVSEEYVAAIFKIK